jgi:hypothetical protein
MPLERLDNLIEIVVLDEELATEPLRARVGIGARSRGR